MYETILLPTDGSAAAEGAIEHGFDVAETHGATVHVLYVVQPVYTSEDGLDQVYEALREEADRATSDVAERAGAVGLEAVTATRRGSPSREIVEYADEHGVDLIVMGTHGRTGLGRYILGSVTEKVVRLADAPVLTVRANDTGGGEEERAEDKTAADDESGSGREG